MKPTDLCVSLPLGVVLPFLAACDGPPPPATTERIEVRGTAIVTLRNDFTSGLVDWSVVDGVWERRSLGGEHRLAQTSTDRAFPVVLLEGRRFSDVDVTVRFRPVSGEADASAGIVFRAHDGQNYYVVRANSLEDNFRLYAVVDGDRRQIAGTRIDAPRLGEWHTLRVTAVGSRIQAYLGGRLLIDHRDERFREGLVGLWTKADAVTEFDDLEIGGVPSD
ncbi:MAG: family 16 glycoside hydrolase [Gemmatimonadota bacterium]